MADQDALNALEASQHQAAGAPDSGSVADLAAPTPRPENGGPPLAGEARAKEEAKFESGEDEGGIVTGAVQDLIARGDKMTAKPGPGVYTPPPQSDGAKALGAMKAGGFSDAEILDYKSKATMAMLTGGFTPAEVDKHWGDDKPDPTKLDRLIQENLSKTSAENGEEVAGDPLSIIKAGFNTSFSGIVVNQPKNFPQLPAGTGLGQKLLYGVGQMAGDIPAMVAGGAAGAAAGAAVPGAGETGVSEAIGAGAGAAALPQAFREVYLDYLNSGKVKTWGDFWDMAKQSLVNVGKSAVEGAVMGPVMSKTGAIVKPYLGNAASNIASVGAGTAAATAVGSAMEGKVPDGDDFITGFVLAMGMHVAGSMVGGRYQPTEAEARGIKNLQDVYAHTGIPPWEVARAAQSDPKIRDEIMAQDPAGQTVTPKLNALAPNEPDQFHEPGENNINHEPTQAKLKEIAKLEMDRSAEARGEKVPGSPARSFAEIASGMHKGEDALPIFRRLEGSGDEAVSPAGAVGRYQIMPGTARQYGFDPHDMTDPAINEQAAKVILNDLSRRFGGDLEAMAVAYNAGPGVARKWVANGRDVSTLPGETQKYLAHLHTMTNGEAMTAAGQPVAEQGGITVYHGSTNAEPNFDPANSPHKTKATWFATDQDVADHFAGENGTTHQVQIADGKYFDFRNADDVAAAKEAFGDEKVGDHFTGGPDATISDEMSKGDWYRMQSPKVTKWLKDNGYEGFYNMEPGENGSKAGLSLAVYDKSKVTSSQRIPPGGGGKSPPPGGGQKRIGAAGEEPIKLNEDMLNDKVNDMIGEPPRKDSEWNPSTLYRQWISELGPMRAIDKMLLTRGFNTKDQMNLEDMARQTYASDARTGYFVKKGILDPITLTEKDPTNFMDAVKAVKEDGGDFEGWRNYMLTKRAIDLHARGLESGHPLSPEDQARLVEMGDKKYQRGTETMNRVMDGALEYGRDSGVFSQEQIEAMQRDNPTYLSYRRVGGDTATQPRGRGFKVSAPVRRFEGDDGQIMDPMRATIDNMGQIIKMSDRNRVIGSVIQLAEQHGMLVDLGLKRVEDARVNAEIAAPGEAFKTYTSITDPEPYTPFLAQRAMRGDFQTNRFMYLRDGEPEVWEAADPDLATFLRGSDTPGQANAVAKVFNFAASMQRAGIVSTPDFPARITMRHQVTAYIADRTNPPPFLTMLRGAMDAVSLSDRYWDWVGKGGAGSSLVEMDRDRLGLDMQNVFNETGVWDRMWNVVRHPLEVSQILMERMDAAARIGYTKQAERQGIEGVKAATLSRKAMIDFVEKGTLAFAQSWARMVPFMRPHFLGLKQFGEAFTERPGSTLAKSLLAVTLPQTVLYAMNYLQDEYGGLPEDQQYRNMPRYFKDGLFVLPQVAGVRLRLPVPFVVGVPFGSLPVRFLDHFVQNDPHAFDNWAQTVAAEFIPPFIPSLAVPAAEAVTNHSFFSGHSLVPAALEKNSPQLQYTDATTEPAKALSNVLGKLDVNTSPIVLENFAREWTGSAGMAALKALNAPFKTTGAPWQMADIPFVGSFLVRNPGMSAQPIQDFYKDHDELATAKADKIETVKRLRGGADLNQAEQSQALGNPLAYANIDRISGSIHMMQSVVQGINNDKVMTTDEKRQATDILYSNMITAARGGSSAIAQVKRYLK